jgi:hypothetical protein
LIMKITMLESSWTLTPRVSAPTRLLKI